MKTPPKGSATKRQRITESRSKSRPKRVVKKPQYLLHAAADLNGSDAAPLSDDEEPERQRKKPKKKKSSAGEPPDPFKSTLNLVLEPIVQYDELSVLREAHLKLHIVLRSRDIECLSEERQEALQAKRESIGAEPNDADMSEQSEDDDAEQSLS